MKKLDAYTYVLWGNLYKLPYIQMIESIVPIVNNIVVVVDERFSDGTIATLERLCLHHPQIILIKERLDLDDPGIDGKTKATARSHCKSDFLIQLDADEIVRLEDLPKIQRLIENFPTNCDIVNTSVINWFNGDNLKYSAAGWTKERISRNLPHITHGIPRNHRIQYGQYYQSDKMSDGAGYIDARTGVSMQSNSLCVGNVRDKNSYENSDAIFIQHYSWYDVVRKWKMSPTWHYFWGLLYGYYKNLDDYTVNRDGDAVDFWNPMMQKKQSIEELKRSLTNEMREHSIRPVPKWVTHPGLMSAWIDLAQIYNPRQIMRGRFQEICKNMQ